MKPGLHITKNSMMKLEKALALLKRTDVLVGIPAEKSERKAGEPLTNAQLGYIHDTGMPELNIPARPFMVVGIRSEKVKIASYLKQATKAALNGDAAKVMQAFHAAGLTGASAVKNRINTGPFQELSRRTLAARRRRGRFGDKPLIDTGQLRNSITYVTRDKK